MRTFADALRGFRPGQTRENIVSLQIDADFDGGNILVRAASEASADLLIRQDANGPWFQWFYFRVRGGAGQTLTMRLLNAGDSAYPGGWLGYRACVSADGETWTRTDTCFTDGVLEISYVAETDSVWFAYFTPYDLKRHQAFIGHAIAAGARAQVLGQSINDRPIHCLSLGSGLRQVWVLGRQHSGETMASWWMEGALDRLLDRRDPAAVALLAAAQVHLVPIVNIDGAARGHLRGNAAGLDLNRQWHAPDPERAPEVAAVLAAMDRTGVDVSLDVHGDETLPHVFVDGCDVDPQATPAQVTGVQRFKDALLAASPAFQIEVGYPPTYGGDEAPGMCTRAVARRFGAVGITLEMPFKNSLEAPDPIADWSAAASSQLGCDTLAAMLAVLQNA